MPDNKGRLTKEEMGAIALKFVRMKVFERGLNFFNSLSREKPVTIAVELGVPKDVADQFIEQIQE